MKIYQQISTYAQHSLLTFVAVVSFSGVLAATIDTNSAQAINVFGGCGSAGGDSAVCASSGDKVGSIFQNLVSTIIYLLGSVAVIAIVIGGVKFVTANGNPEAIKSAKNIILYAVIGLVVAVLAQPIVKFVAGSL